MVIALKPMGAREPADQNWAAQGDPKDVVQNLIARKDNFFAFVDSSNLFARVSRNWRYFYNLYHKNISYGGMEILRAGEEGEQSLMTVNHFRSLLHLLITYTTQNRPAWDTRAINSDYKSMQQAKLGNDILDFYMEDKNAEAKLRRAVEDSLIFGVGYLTVTWDPEIGAEIAGDPQSGEMFREGDVALRNPTIFDVVYDYTIRDWDQCTWTLVRTPVNKWDLVAGYPDRKDDILNAAMEEYQDYEQFRIDRVGSRNDTTDQVDLWTLYHDKTPSVPQGRQLLYCGDEPLEDGPLTYDKKPVYRIVPADFVLTSFGYTPGFDLQGTQEALNSEYSTILTNHKNLGPTKIWFQTGDNISLADLEPGINAIQCNTKPEPINLCQTPREFFEFAKMLRGDMEYLSGVNSVARGQPEASLKSGAALALIDQKAMQYASVLIQNYYTLLSEIGTAIILILKARPISQRTIYIAGINRRSELREFEKKDLIAINRVTVQAGNPLSRTIAGRTEIAQQLLQNGLVSNPQEYLTVLQTGQLKPLTNSSESQLNVIYDENDKLKNGEPVFAAITDDQVLHIQEHASVLDSTEMRQNPIIAKGVAAHNLQHMELLMNPQYMMYAQVFGYRTPLPPMMSSPSTPEGGNRGAGNPTIPPPPGIVPPEPPKGPKIPQPAQANLQSAMMQSQPGR